MDRLISIIGQERDALRHGDYPTLSQHLVEFGTALKECPLKDSTADVWKYYKATYDLQQGLGYVTPSVVSTAFLLCSEVYAQLLTTGNDQGIDVLVSLADYYFSSEGTLSIQNKRVIVDDSSPALYSSLEGKKRGSEQRLEQYWGDLSAVITVVDTVCCVVDASFGRKTDYNAMCAVEGSTTKTFDWGAVSNTASSDWLDAHFKTFVSDTRGVDVVYLCTEGVLLHLGFFHLVQEKTGYARFNRREKQLLPRK